MMDFLHNAIDKAVGFVNNHPLWGTVIFFFTAVVPFFYTYVFSIPGYINETVELYQNFVYSPSLNADVSIQKRAHINLSDTEGEQVGSLNYLLMLEIQNDNDHQVLLKKIKLGKRELAPIINSLEPYQSIEIRLEPEDILELDKLEIVGSKGTLWAMPKNRATELKNNFYNKLIAVHKADKQMLSALLAKNHKINSDLMLEIAREIHYEDIATSSDSKSRD